MTDWLRRVCNNTIIPILARPRFQTVALGAYTLSETGSDKIKGQPEPWAMVSTLNDDAWFASKWTWDKGRAFRSGRVVGGGGGVGVLRTAGSGRWLRTW